MLTKFVSVERLLLTGEMPGTEFSWDKRPPASPSARRTLLAKLLLALPMDVVFIPSPFIKPTEIFRIRSCSGLARPPVSTWSGGTWSTASPISRSPTSCSSLTNGVDMRPDDSSRFAAKAQGLDFIRAAGVNRAHALDHRFKPYWSKYYCDHLPSRYSC